MLDEDDEKNHDDMAAIRKKLRSKDSKLTKEKLAMKIENFSRVLAAGAASASRRRVTSCFAEEWLCGRVCVPQHLHQQCRQLL